MRLATFLFLALLFINILPVYAQEASPDATESAEEGDSVTEAVEEAASATSTGSTSNTSDIPPPDLSDIYIVYPEDAFGLKETALKAGDQFLVNVKVAGPELAEVTLDASKINIGKIPFTYIGGNYVRETSRITVPDSVSDGTYVLIIRAQNASGGESTAEIPLIIDNTPPSVSISSLAGPDGTYMRQHGTATIQGAFDGTGSSASIIDLNRLRLANDCATILPYNFLGVPVPMTQLGSGPFNYKDLTADFEEFSAATACIEIVLTIRDGAGNTTSATSSPIHYLLDDAPAPSGSAMMSNVLFLPGIEGSRLYDANERLWEPYDGNILDIFNGNPDGRLRALKLGGETGIHTKDGDIVASSNNTDYYAAFSRAMDSLVASGTMHAWKPIAYDWRLSLPTIITGGSEHDGGIYYEEATDTPYIAQQLISLAASSGTSRVTIVAHSNGGLVAKELMRELGDTETAHLIDKVVLVGAPQAGTPEAIGSLLFGADLGILVPHTGGLLSIVSEAAARELTLTLPMAYHLLPSYAYFSSVQDEEHPILTFAHTAPYTNDIYLYGPHIDSWDSLEDFLSGGDGRSPAADGDITHAAVASASLLAYANDIHASLDTWTAPASTTVYQIAGWGEDTVSGIDLYTEPRWGGLLGVTTRYRPKFTEDGDGTVTVPSALLTPPSSASSIRLWFNLAAYNEETGRNVRHAEEMETSPLLDFIGKVLRNEDLSSPYFSLSEPETSDESSHLRFILHDGDLLSVSDGSRTLSVDKDGAIAGSLPGASAGVFGVDQYISVLAGIQYELLAVAAGTADLDIDEYANGLDRIVTLSDIPLTTGAVGRLSLSTLDDAGPLDIDADGDGNTDISLPVMPDNDSPYVPREDTPDDAATSTDDSTMSTPAEKPLPSSGGGSHSSSEDSMPIEAAASVRTVWENPAQPPKIAKPVEESGPITKDKVRLPSASEIRSATKQAGAAEEQTSLLAAAVAMLPDSARNVMSGIVESIYTFLNLVAQTIIYLLHLIV